MQTAGKPSYYDPEGETIYLSSPAASEAGAPKKGRRRGPEMNDVLGYVGSATLLVAYSSVRNSILRRLRGVAGAPRHRRGLSHVQVPLRREPNLAQAPRRRRLHEPLWVCVRAFRCGNFTPAPSRQPSRHRRNVCSMHRWASTASARRPTPPCSSRSAGSASRSPRS